MVTEEVAWVLRNTNIDPLVISKYMSCTENECWDYLADLQRALREAEESYEPLAIQQEMRAWVETIPDKNNIRIEAIKEQLMDAKIHPEKHDVPRLLLEVQILKGTVERPTPEMIARAKEYPLEQLLDTKGKKGNVSCPFHKDQNPSFQITKKNTWKCHSCQEYGDSISRYQKLNNVGFIQAVRALTT